MTVAGRPITPEQIPYLEVLSSLFSSFEMKKCLDESDDWSSLPYRLMGNRSPVTISKKGDPWTER